MVLVLACCTVGLDKAGCEAMKSFFSRSSTPKSQKNNIKGGKIMISVNLAEHQMLHPDQILLGEVHYMVTHTSRAPRVSPTSRTH